MDGSKKITAHIAAVISVAIWSSTYISTRVLVRSLLPVEISLLRFIIGTTVLYLVNPGQKTGFSIRTDGIFILSGFLGIFLYYFLENSAALYTQASNIALIVSSIPIITALLAPVFDRNEVFSPRHAVALAASFAGILVIMTGDTGTISLSARGDLLALGAAFAFSLYSIVTKKASEKTDALSSARKANTYGLVFIFLAWLITPGKASAGTILRPETILHLTVLGIFASGLCFLLWNYALRGIGSSQAGKYIYLVPVFTGILSYIALGERFTPLKLIGTAIILLSLLFSGGGRVRRNANAKAGEITEPAESRP